MTPVSFYSLLSKPWGTVRLEAHPVHLIAHPPEPVDNQARPQNGPVKMKFWPRIFLLGTVFLALAQTGRGQSAAYWRVYKVYDGLHQSTCVSVSVTPNGKVLVRHPDGTFITELDGYNVKSMAPPEPASDFSGSPGGQLWVMARDGTAGRVQTGRLGDASGAGNRRGRQCRRAVLPGRTGSYYFFVRRPVDGIQRGKSRAASNPRVAPERANAPRNIHGHDRGARRRTVDHGRTRLGQGAKVRHLYGTGKVMERLSPAGIAANSQPARAARGRAKAGSPSLPSPWSTAKKWWCVSTVRTGRRSPPAWKKSGARGGAATGFCGLRRRIPCFNRRRDRRGLPEYQEISARQFFDMAMEPGGTFWLAMSGGLFHYAPPLWRSPRPVQQINAPDSLPRGRRGRPALVCRRRQTSLAPGRNPSRICTAGDRKRATRSPSAPCFRSRTERCCWTRLTAHSNSGRTRACSALFRRRTMSARCGHWVC